MSLEFRIHRGWDVKKNEMRRYIKVVEGFNFQAKEFYLYVLASGQPLKVLQEDSNVRPVLWKDDSGGNVEDRWGS